MFRNFILFLAAAAALSFTVAELKPVDGKDAVTFTIKNFGFNTSGSFSGLKGIIKWDANNPSAAVFKVTVDAKTINTGIDSRDNHLRKEEYLDVTKHPTLNFESTAVTANQMTGRITIKGVTKEVSFPYTVKPANGGYLFEGEFTINRKDFGVGGGSVSMSNAVDVHLRVPAK